MPKALVTGISGQDGSYLAELLLSKGYEVHGIVRRSSSPNLSRLSGCADKIHFHYGDLSDGIAWGKLLAAVQPDEVYNLAAQSHVQVSFEAPEYTADTTGTGSIRLLEAVRIHAPNCRIYQASSSEMFGSSPPPQNELTPFHPRSPYGCSKVFAYWATVNYREAYNMHASNGILFNHESPRRGENFVTRKITRAVAAIKHGLQKELVLGNLEAQRDWGFAGDYVEAMWRMLQQPHPNDFVVATGEMRSVHEFLEIAFKHVGLDWPDFVTTDEKFIRPAEVDALQGDPTKARQILGWKPKTAFEDLVKMMVDADYNDLCRNRK
jgi:GDPmannose 4,6-dehydratase